MRVISREPEAHLVELLQLVENQPQGWTAIALHFSKLLEHYRSEYQLKIATNLMNDLLGDRDGAIYLCSDSTIYVAVRNFPRQLTDKMIFQLRYLYMDDPLAYTADGEENPTFCTVYDIESQWQEFTNLIKRRMVARVMQAQGSIPRVAAAVAASEGGSRPMTKREANALTVNNLSYIEEAMRDADITATIRRQPICAALAGASVKTVFDEMYINIEHLKQSLGVEVDLLSNRWLFKYLTQQLDERVLDTIQRNSVRYLSKAISINLNVTTLLSSRFMEFDAAVKSSIKTNIVIELQIADVFEDMTAFLLAKELAQKLGYRICLDGVTDLSIEQIDRVRLGFDLIKLLWDGGKNVPSDEKKLKLSEAVKQCGNNRVILTRCDNKKAVEYGQSLGITLFQGRYLDSLVNPTATVKN